MQIYYVYETKCYMCLQRAHIITVLEKRKIGNFAMAGARSLVTHDIPDSEIHVGLPAKFLRRIMED